MGARSDAAGNDPAGSSISSSPISSTSSSTAAARLLPVVTLTGTPHQQGLAHGRQLADRIRHNLAVYFGRFEREGGLKPAEVLARVAEAWPSLAAAHPAYAAGVAGIAEGVGEPLERIAALNLRYEILYHQFTAKAMVDGCTSFALLPEATADGHLYMGQNWDWIPEVQGAVLHIQEEGRPEQLCFTEAGIFGGKIGLNAAGLGVAINGLTSTADDWRRLGTPVHVRTWQVLRAERLEDAAAAVLAEPRSCSVHLLVSQAGARAGASAPADEGAKSGAAAPGSAPSTPPDRAWGLETAPTAHRRLEPEAGVYSHANHFRDEEAIGVRQPPSPNRPGSVHREARCRTLLDRPGEPWTPEAILDQLRDHDGHPNSVCRHPDPARGPDQAYHTVTSVLMDLTAGRMWISDGPPCGAGYLELGLG